MEQANTTENQASHSVLSAHWVAVTPAIPTKEGEELGIATAFFYWKEDWPYLVTNRHVLLQETENHHPDTLRIRVHVEPIHLGRNENIDLPLYRDEQPLWLEHRSGIPDIAILPLSHIQTSRWVIAALSSKDFPPHDLRVRPGEDLIVIGYPRGFHDEVANLPTVRNASTASAYPLPFRGAPFFVIDARLHTGMSGSPVLTKPSTIVVTDSGVRMLARPVSFFLGIFSGFYDWNDEPSGLNVVWFARLIEEILASS
jgi:hypothetical protein